MRLGRSCFLLLSVGPRKRNATLSTLLTQITSLQTLQSTTSAENRQLRDECTVEEVSPKSSSSPQPPSPTRRKPRSRHGHGHGPLVYFNPPQFEKEDVSSSLPPPPTPTTPLIDEDILEIWTLPSASVSSGTNGTTTQQVSSNGVGRGDPRSRRKVFVAKAGGLRVI